MTPHLRYPVTLSIICFVLMGATNVYAQDSMRAPKAEDMNPASASEVPAAHLIQPEELAAGLRSLKSPKPLVFQVGFRVLYAQAHIPGSEYVAAASSAEGVRQLRERVEKLPRDKTIVLYCGCCPWSHCPNVQPAYELLRGMGFTNVKVLFIAHDFGTDWVSKGYPVETGQ
ncbi:MAG TPA: rhodanese-like domain-containing protein [Terriglobales bacterium]|nr:rhodanese-like domain-containing protein [Terriglobales bacterium]